MITRKQKRIILGLSGLLPIILGGCATPETIKPGVRTAAAKPATTYVIQRAAIRTPATDRAWQQRKASRNNQLAAKRAQLLSAPKRAKPVAAPAKSVAMPTRQNTQQPAKSSAYYQARYKASQQAAKKRNAQIAKNKARLTHQKHQKKVAAPAQIARNTADSKRQFYLKRWEQLQAEKKLEAKKAEVRVERVIHNAKQQIGTKYVWGGASPKTGFDCSGLVQHSMKKGANVKVPRTAAEQYKASVKVPSKQASRGDLIFFKTRGKSVSHVGIYLGENKFVHAPRTGRKITTSNLSGYWKQRFVGFGRIPGACKVPV
uniref:NlpC/P60 domain-containing protein n=1 Tax=uncultured Thiotrichaceae bacterium TaxID=298394 RepID=A0A6S6UDM0_9GAMM|nr:MAG: Unknown protein [uncultured Thiotrichaceae bacterium]